MDKLIPALLDDVTRGNLFRSFSGGRFLTRIRFLALPDLLHLGACSQSLYEASGGGLDTFDEWDARGFSTIPFSIASRLTNLCDLCLIRNDSPFLTLVSSSALMHLTSLRLHTVPTPH